MDGDSWSARLSSASKRYQTALQSRSNFLLGFDELDGDDDIREEYPCPYCSECFDIVGLCSHIDEEHPVQAKIGRKRKARKGGNLSTLSLLRKELREGSIQSLFGGTSLLVNSTNAMPDPLLSSFILPIADDLVRTESQSSAETISAKKIADESASERNVKSTPFSIKDHEEKTRRCKFVQGMLLSTIFEDSP